MGNHEKSVSIASSATRRVAAVWVGCWMAVACGGEAPEATEDGNSGPQTNGAAAAVQVGEPGTTATVVADIQHSPTHRIQFIELADSTVMVHEALHADLDGIDSGLRAAGVRAGMPLDEMYVVAARDQVDWQIVDRLRGKQIQLDEDQPMDLEGQPELVDLEAGAAPSSVNEHESTPPVQIEAENGAESVATLQAAACSTPAGMDWAADERWFKDNFCGVNYQYCDALDPSHRASGPYFKYSEGHYYNQSFCSTAPAAMTYRYATACSIFGCTRRTFTAASGTVAPRTVWSVWSSKGKGADGKYSQWGAEITSDGGDFTGLAYFAYTN